MVEKIASQHFALYLNSLQESPFKCRSDATLIVRNFNFPMPNAIQVPRNRINVSKMNIFHYNIDSEKENVFDFNVPYI